MTQATILIKSFEGCRLTAYQDGGGVWTIGWGATGPKISQGLTWTQAQADIDLDRRVAIIDEELMALAKKDSVILSQGERAALTSLIYNVGLEAIAKSTLWGYLKMAQSLNAACEFPKWSKDNAVRIKGLLRRRFLEAYEFLS